MANSKRKCNVCNTYWAASTFYRPGICSLDCFIEKAKAKNRRRSERRTARYGTSSLTIATKRRVRNRDGNRCRWCSDPDELQVHHINYRSQGGPDEDWNLITLCGECHRRAHGNKRVWQPVLRGVIWLHYVEGKRVTVAQFARWNGMAA